MFVKKEELNRSIPTPLYYQLKCILLNSIKNGEIAENETIPTEVELQKMFNISRATIRQAISELVQEGWLDRKTSKGTFVLRPDKQVSHFHAFEPFHQQVKKLGKVAKTELQSLKIIEAQDFLAQEMQLQPSDKIISMFRVRFADDEPMVTIHNYLPFSLCDFILSHDFKTESLYEILMGNDQTTIETTKTIISAALPTIEDHQLLHAQMDMPILSCNTIARSYSGVIIDFAYSHYRGDMNRFEIDVSPEKGNHQAA